MSVGSPGKTEITTVDGSTLPTPAQPAAGGAIDVSFHDSAGADRAAESLPTFMVETETTAAYFAAVVESSNDAILSKTLDGRVLSWNAAAERLFGYGAAEMIGQPIIRLFPPELVAEEKGILERVGRGERVERYETVRIAKDGRRLDVVLTISPIRDASGRIVAASKIIQDLTERKRTEAQFYMLADLLPTMCWMADAKGSIFWYNRLWYDYTGTTFEQMEGWGWQSVHASATLPKVLEQWQACLETGQSFEMTFPLRGADGVFRPFLTRVSPVLGADGKIIRWLGTNTEVTEERRQADLREQFTAVLGHDLRNPLSAILSGLKMLRMTPLNARAVLLADMMRDSAYRMSALIDDTTDLARCRLGDGLALNRNPEHLEPVLRGVIAELVSVNPERMIETDFVLQQPIYCDRGRVAQLFSNLIGNALTHGSVDRPVRVRAVTGADGFEFSVANEGTPIPPTDLPRLFAPFYRGAARPSRQGLGLGLYIAHEIATAHGGMLEVASTPAETRFTFRMPVTSTPEPKAVRKE